MRSSRNSRMFNGFGRWWQPERTFVTIIQTHFFTPPNIWWRWLVELAMQMRPLSLVWLFWFGFSSLLTGKARVVPDLSGSMAVHILKQVNYELCSMKTQAEDERVCAVFPLWAGKYRVGHIIKYDCRILILNPSVWRARRAWPTSTFCGFGAGAAYCLKNTCTCTHRRMNRRMIASY